MRRISIRIVIAAALVVSGWALGRAQTAQPDFELFITAPRGETTVECVRGCTLAWVERGVNEKAVATTTFSYGCSGSADGCRSGRVGGWIKK